MTEHREGSFVETEEHMYRKLTPEEEDQILRSIYYRKITVRGVFGAIGEALRTAAHVARSGAFDYTDPAIAAVKRTDDEVAIIKAINDPEIIPVVRMGRDEPPLLVDVEVVNVERNDH